VAGALSLKGYVVLSLVEGIVNGSGVESVAGAEVRVEAAVEQRHKKELDQAVECNPVMLPVGDTVVL
jgi:hypothetical protein